MMSRRIVSGRASPKRNAPPRRPKEKSTEDAKVAPPFEADVRALQLGKTLDFMRMLWALDHSLQTASKQMQSRLGVTGLQRLVIRIVGRFPGISAGELATVLHVHPSTLTGVLKVLVQRGALGRSLDPADARRALFTLTARGRQLDELKVGTVEARVRNALSEIGPDRINAVKRGLQALITALDVAS